MRNLRDSLFIWRRSLLILLLICCGIGISNAQQSTIKGKVSSASEGALPGVNIVVKGTVTGAMTDMGGTYTITVPGPDAILVFTSIGYLPQSITVGKQTTVDVVLVPNVSELGEVVVTGYGVQKRATISGAVSAVQGVILKKAPTNNISNSLVGQISGLMVVNRSGEPGADDSDLRIRGINTLNNSTALIVIDGIANRDGGFARLNPNDIESITILKDASAAIYGAQAANGVIMVTTKRGKAGAPEIGVQMNYGMNQPTRLPSVLDAQEYATILNELDEYSGRVARYTAQDIKQFGDGSDPFGHPNTDWYGETIKPWSPQNNTNITLSGGNADGVTYFISGGTTKEDGYFKNSSVGYNQYNFRSNIDAKIRKNIKLRFDVSGRQEARKYTQTRGGSTFRYLIGMKPTEPAFWPQRSTDKTRLPGPDFEGGQNPAVTSTDITGYDHDNNYIFQSNIGIDLTDLFTVKGLSIVANAAFDQSFREYKNWKKPWTLYTWDKVTMNANGEPDLVGSNKGIAAPQLSQNSSRSKSFTGNMRANYVKKFGDHNVAIMAGIERQTIDSYWFSAYRNEFVTDQLEQLRFGANNTSKTNDGSMEQRARLNYFGRVNYDYKSKYLAEFVWRYDGSQIFDPAYRWGFFPGVSVGWVLSEENFMANVSFVNRLKLRGSYGTMGNDKIDPYQYLALFEFGGSYIFNENTNTKSLRPSSVANQGVSWEVAHNSDIGLEGSLFNNHVNFEIDLFKNLRTDILYPANASIPLSAGFSPPDQNIGEVENKGFDLSLSYTNTIGSDISWSLGFNGGYAKNKVLFWDEPAGRLDWQVSTGKPMGGQLLYNALDVFKDQAAVDAYPHWPGARPGDIRFEDVNKDGAITVDDRVQTTKSNFPTFVGGVNFNMAWKGLELYILMQGSTGAEQYIQVPSGEFGNYLHDFADGRWTTANPNSSKPRAYNREDQYWISGRNTHFMRSTNYLRAKNVRLSYTLPETLLKKASIKYTQVFISAMNLFTWDKYKVFDPENADNSGSAYPQRRLFNMGFNLTF